VKDKIVNVIEAVSCMCSPQSLPIIAKRVETKLASLGRPVQAKHALAIVEARRRARVGTTRDADLVSVAVLLFGALLVAGYSALNAYERRRETGVLLAIAARPRHVAWVMLQKMLLLGLAGGALGCWLADALLTHYGMQIFQKLHGAMRSYVLAFTGWEMYAVAVGLALGLTVLPGLVGVFLASWTDPAKTLQES